jgi:hypothetical protein
MVRYQHCLWCLRRFPNRLHARCFHWISSLDCRYMSGNTCFTRHFQLLIWESSLRQIGDILQTVATTSSPTPESISSLLTTPEIIFKLIFLSFLSLAPILGRDRLRTLISHSVPVSPISSTPGAHDSMSKWLWVQDWRSKIRIASRSRAQEREQNLKQLEVLVQEKRAFELSS